MADMYARPLVLDASLTFTSPPLVDLLAYWNEKRLERTMPSRADIDPTDPAMRPHLGFIVLIDVIGRPPRFRFRLIGSKITEEVGRDSTGRWLDELYSPADYENMIVAYRWVVQNRAPMRITGNLRHANRAWLDMESLDLPLSSDGDTVDMILTRSVLSRAPR
ncbi:MAG TPA: PAS domain-containing protein [Candidatus Cybelea sp.]|nr:PAS domain-containing protein [Candidatus Cybelea sp.]